MSLLSSGGIWSFRQAHPAGRHAVSRVGPGTTRPTAAALTRVVPRRLPRPQLSVPVAGRPPHLLGVRDRYARPRLIRHGWHRGQTCSSPSSPRSIVGTWPRRCSGCWAIASGPDDALRDARALPGPGHARDGLPWRQSLTRAGCSGRALAASAAERPRDADSLIGETYRRSTRSVPSVSPARPWTRRGSLGALAGRACRPRWGSARGPLRHDLLRGEFGADLRRVRAVVSRRRLVRARRRAAAPPAGATWLGLVHVLKNAGAPRHDAVGIPGQRICLPGVDGCFSISPEQTICVDATGLGWLVVLRLGGLAASIATVLQASAAPGPRPADRHRALVRRALGFRQAGSMGPGVARLLLAGSRRTLP